MKTKTEPMSIPTAEAIITSYGGSIEPGCNIIYHGDNPMALEAIIFLVEEHDYDFAVDYEHKAIMKFVKGWTSLSLPEMLCVGFIACAGTWFLCWALYLWAR